MPPVLPAIVSNFSIDKYFNDFSKDSCFIKVSIDGAADEATLIKMKLHSLMLAAKVVTAR